MQQEPVLELSPLAVQTAADALRAAYPRTPIPPISGRLIPNTAAAGYAVQDFNTRVWEREGRRRVGAKIGLTSAAVQAQIGVDEPDFGILFEDMAVASGALVPFSRLHQPRAEGEIAFCLAADLPDPEVDLETVVAAVAWVAPAIEIVASRIEGWRCRIADTVADNASAGLYVVGEGRRSLADFDVRAAAMVLTEDGVPVSEGSGGACLGSPLNAVRWLAATMARLGRPLRAGDVLLSGALGPLVWLRPGSSYELCIPGLGDAQVQFSEA